VCRDRAELLEHPDAVPRGDHYHRGVDHGEAAVVPYPIVSFHCGTGTILIHPFDGRRLTELICQG
jgi:hypothetical protein